MQLPVISSSQVVLVWSVKLSHWEWRYKLRSCIVDQILIHQISSRVFIWYWYINDCYDIRSDSYIIWYWYISWHVSDIEHFFNNVRHTNSSNLWYPITIAHGYHWWLAAIMSLCDHQSAPDSTVTFITTFNSDFIHVNFFSSFVVHYLFFGIFSHNVIMICYKFLELFLLKRFEFQR